VLVAVLIVVLLVLWSGDVPVAMLIVMLFALWQAG
jgi:hypothetical protein